MKKNCTLFIGLALTILAVPAFAAKQFECNDSEGVLAPFLLTLEVKSTLLGSDYTATLSAGERINEGSYFAHIIGGRTRLAGLTRVVIGTTGALGEVNLSLIDDSVILFGSGTVKYQDEEKTVLLNCTPAAEQNI